ncbi:hypothetical protein FA95DRAFT_1458782, partial [Auriscalpium vulgare]
LRTAAFVPVLYGPAIPSAREGEEESEAFCRAMLILFKPWRTLNDLKTRSTWYAAFHAHTFHPYLQRIIANIKLEHECASARSKADDERR